MPRASHLVWFLVAALLVLHQDYWQWDDSRLVLGWVPISLAYHTVLSVATAVVWYLATRFCWPAGIEAASIDGSDGDGAT